MSTCVYGEKRKGERVCPALDGKICSRCCGRHRLTDIDCPVNCRWLEKAMKTNADSFFSSSAFEESDLASWLRNDVMSGTGPSVPGGQTGLNILFMMLDVIHWKFNSSSDAKRAERVVKDAIRYLEQTHTGQVMSPESAPSSLAEALEDILNTLFESDRSSEKVQEVKEDFITCISAFFDWCDRRDLDYGEVLNEFYSEYNLEGWTPVERQDGKLRVRRLKEQGSGKGTDSANRDQATDGMDSDIIVPGT